MKFSSLVLGSFLFISSFGPIPICAESLKAQLPRPSGSYGIGRIAFDWVDLTRTADISQKGNHAEIMVYVWYPTELSSRGTKGVLFPGAKQIDADPNLSEGLKKEVFGGNWPLVVSGSITSHAKKDAPVAPRPKAFPVIIYSPGAFMSSFQSTSFIEDMVSHGFIVASVEHAYETFAVWFPDGRVIAYSPKEIQPEFLPSPNANQSEFNARLQAWSRHRAEVRAADMSFALSKLIGLNTGRDKSPLTGRLDLTHVAAVGHSRGGWAALIACRKDTRFSACVNLDGSAAGDGLSFPPTPEPTQPVLFVEVKPQIPSDWIVLKDLHISAEAWIRRWHKIAESEFQKFPAGGDFVELKAPGLSHNSFTDEVVLRAAKDGKLKDYRNALDGLRLSERVTRIFLSQKLKLDKKSVLRSTPTINVKEFPRRELQNH